MKGEPLMNKVPFVTKEKLDEISKYVLNIRVGGNDFCKEFGIRRGLTQNIYQVLPLTSLLSDIITVFSRDYVISAPVFEYFSIYLCIL